MKNTALQSFALEVVQLYEEIDQIKQRVEFYKNTTVQLYFNQLARESGQNPKNEKNAKLFDLLSKYTSQGLVVFSLGSYDVTILKPGNIRVNDFEELREFLESVTPYPIIP